MGALSPTPLSRPDPCALEQAVALLRRTLSGNERAQLDLAELVAIGAGRSLAEIDREAVTDHVRRVVAEVATLRALPGRNVHAVRPVGSGTLDAAVPVFERAVRALVSSYRHDEP